MTKWLMCMKLILETACSDDGDHSAEDNLDATIFTREEQYSTLCLLNILAQNMSLILKKHYAMSASCW